jgi:hypothetical protein
VTVRAAALAALAVLGAAGDEDVAKLDIVVHDKKSGFCMKMAKLNLYQCLAVAGFRWRARRWRRCRQFRRRTRVPNPRHPRTCSEDDG